MSDYFDRVERQLVRRVEEGGGQTWRSRLTAGNLAVVAAVLVVVVVAGFFLAARGGRETAPPLASHPALTVMFTASSHNGAAIDQSVRLLNERLHAVLPGARVVRSGGGVTVTLTHATPGARNRILALAAPGRLAFYDWEADVLAPSGKPVANELPSQAPDALEISQGSGSAAPGATGAGCVTLQQALALAARLAPGAPRRTEYLHGLKLRLPTGFVVLQATDAGTPSDGAYLLRGVPILTSTDIVNPRASRGDITFRFTPAGRRAFQSATAAVAHRGARVSGLGQTLNQHFAIALDDQLIEVPFVDFRIYPDGVNGDQGAQISGDKYLAVLLRYGPLPVHLRAAG